MSENVLYLSYYYYYIINVLYTQVLLVFKLCNRLIMSVI